MLDCILDQYDAQPQQQQREQKKQQQQQQSQQQQPLDSSSGPHSRTELQHFCAPFFLLLNLCLVDSSPLSQSSASWCSSQRGAAAVSSGSPAALAAAVVKEAAPYPRWQQLLTQVIRVHSRYLQYMAAEGAAAAAAGKGAAAAGAGGEGAGAAAATAAWGDAVEELELSLQYKGTAVALSQTQKPVGKIVCEMGARIGMLNALTNFLDNGMKQIFYEPDVSWWVLGQVAAMVKLTGRVHNVRIQWQLEQQQRGEGRGGGQEEGKGGEEGQQLVQGPLNASSSSGERSSSSGRGNGSCSSRKVTDTTRAGSDTTSSSSSSYPSSSRSSTGASSREGSAGAAGGVKGGRTSSNEKVTGHGWDPTSAVLLEVPFPQQQIQQYTEGTCSSKLLAAVEQIAGSGRMLAECRGELEAKVLRDIKEYEQMVVRSCGLTNVLIERAVAVARGRAEGGGRRAIVVSSSSSNSPEDVLFSVAGMVLCLNAAVITYAFHAAVNQEQGQQQQQNKKKKKKKKKERNKKQEEQGSQQQNLLQPQKDEQHGQQQEQGDDDDALQYAALVAQVGQSCSTCLNGLVHLVHHSPGSEVKSFASQNASVLMPLLLQLMHAAPSRDVRYLVWGLMDRKRLDRQVGGEGGQCK